MISVVSFEDGLRRAWDGFVAGSKNGVFLFYRDYLEYHADRFPDASLMFYDPKVDQVVALIPATLDSDGVVSSHAGLTFGGVVSDAAMKIERMLEVFDALLKHYRDLGAQKLIYKAIPHIYHQLPAEEDLYALFRVGARLYRRDVATTIEMLTRLPLSKGRKYAAKQARKHDVEVARSYDFECFMAIEERVLGERYGVRPVHTAAELKMLAERFPDNLKLFTAHAGGQMLAGIVIYESALVAHAQYIAASEEGRRMGAPDAIVEYLLDDYYAAKKYFDFGISTEEGGQRLNEGLAANKQGFGGRAVVYDFYEINF